MSKKIGRLINIGLGKETVRGTGVSPTYWIPKSNITFEDKVVKAISTLNYGNIGEGNQELVALKHAEGNLEGDILDKSFGLLLLAAFGTVASAAYLSAYKHTYTLQNDNQHDSLTIAIDDTLDATSDKTFELAMLNSLEISATPDNIVKFTANFMSKSSQDGNYTATYVAQNKFLGRHVIFKLATLTTGLDAATAVSLKSITLTINKNLLLDNVLGTVQPEDIVNQKISIEGKIELNYTDETYKNLMLNGTYNAMRIDIVNTDVTIGTTNPALRFDFSRCAFDAWEPTRENDALASQVINFRAMYDITNGNIINSCYLVNEVASY